MLYVDYGFNNNNNNNIYIHTVYNTFIFYYTETRNLRKNEVFQQKKFLHIASVT